MEKSKLEMEKSKLEKELTELANSQNIEETLKNKLNEAMDKIYNKYKEAVLANDMETALMIIRNQHADLASLCLGLKEYDDETQFYHAIKGMIENFKQTLREKLDFFATIHAKLKELRDGKGLSTPKKEEPKY